MKALKQIYYKAGVAIILWMMTESPSWAVGAGRAQDITDRMVASISNLPKLISSIGFLTGLTLTTLGVLKIKDHVENPQQTALKEGAIRLTTGGALVSMPAIFGALGGVFGAGENAVYVGHANLVQPQ